MTPHFLSLDDLPLSSLASGYLREVAEQAYEAAVLRIAADFQVNDTVIFAEAREVVMAEALVETLDSPDGVVMEGNVAVLLPAARAHLIDAMERALQAVLQGFSKDSHLHNFTFSSTISRLWMQER